MTTPHALSPDYARDLRLIATRVTAAPWRPAMIAPGANVKPSETGYVAVMRGALESTGKVTVVAITGAAPPLSEMNSPDHQSTLDAHYLAKLSPPIVLSLLATLDLARTAVHAFATIPPASSPDAKDTDANPFLRAMLALGRHLDGIDP